MIKVKLKPSFEDCRICIDFMLSAVGKRDFIERDMINTAKRQLLLDIGINRNDEGKLCGDANSEIYDIDTLDYTPVPGGFKGRVIGKY